MLNNQVIKRERSMSRQSFTQQPTQEDQLADINQKVFMLRKQQWFGKILSEDLAINDTIFAILPNKESSQQNQILLEDEKFKYNEIYHIFLIPFRIERYMILNTLIIIQAVLYNMIILPLRVALSFPKTLLDTLLSLTTQISSSGNQGAQNLIWQRKLARKQMEVARIIIIAVSTLILIRSTNSSVIYHWIRGQSLFKLYMIKAVIEISDLLFKGFGQALFENLARDFYQDTEKINIFKSQKISNKVMLTIDIIMMIFYTTVHSYIITLEMFTLHVALTSTEESVLSFLFYNNFTELKISVFKKVDIPSLFQYTVNDCLERFHLIIYLTNILFTTQQDRLQIARYIAYILVSEISVDWLKHFFITRLNKLSTNMYKSLKTMIYFDYIAQTLNLTKEEQKILHQDLLQKQQQSSGSIAILTPEVTQSIIKSVNVSLMYKVMDCESVLAIQRNMLILPQICLILRNIIDSCMKYRHHQSYLNNSQLTQNMLWILALILSICIIIRIFLKKYLVMKATRVVLDI